MVVGYYTLCKLIDQVIQEDLVQRSEVALLIGHTVIA